VYKDIRSSEATYVVCVDEHIPRHEYSNSVNDEYHIDDIVSATIAATNYTAARKNGAICFQLKLYKSRPMWIAAA